jgi:hypothetical protein
MKFFVTEQQDSPAATATTARFRWSKEAMSFSLTSHAKLSAEP